MNLFHSMVDVSHEVGEAVLQALRTLPARTVEGNLYLPLEGALDAVGPHLFPGGVEAVTDFAYLSHVVQYACHFLGFGPEELLAPPRVPYEARGSYLKRLPPLRDEHLSRALQEVLSRHAVVLSRPVEALAEQALLYRVGQLAWQLPSTQLTPGHLAHLAQRCAAFLTRHGWQRQDHLDDPYWKDPHEAAYTRTLQADLGALRARLRASLEEGTRETATLQAEGLRAAFHPHVTGDPDGVLPPGRWRALFDELGFTFQHPRVRAHPLPLSDDAPERIAAALATLPAYQHPEYGPVLRREDVVNVAYETLSLDPSTLSDDHRRQVSRGVIPHALARVGYLARAYPVAALELSPSPAADTSVFRRVPQLPDGTQRADFAAGFPVEVPAFLHDGDRLVYLELVGPRQAVHANWAALRAGGRGHRFAGASFSVQKEDRVHTVKQALPCGWDQWALLHGQLSLQSTRPDDPFYLLADGAPVPALFFPMLVRTLRFPVQEAWAAHLWLDGQRRGLIQPLEGKSFGLGGWRVDVTDDHGWQTLLQEALRDGHIHF